MSDGSTSEPLGDEGDEGEGKAVIVISLAGGKDDDDSFGFRWQKFLIVEQNLCTFENCVGQLIIIFIIIIECEIGAFLVIMMKRKERRD